MEILRDIFQAIENMGPWAPVLFGLFYLVATSLLIPATFLMLGAGILFGVFRGTVTVLIAASFAALGVFLIGRYSRRDWIKRKIEENPKLRAVDQAIGRDGWKIVFLMRLTPVLPFALCNYTFGLTRIRVRDYLFASWIGMFPGIFLHVYLGSLLGSLAALGQARQRTPAEWALYGIGFLAAVAAIFCLSVSAKKVLREQIGSERLA